MLTSQRKRHLLDLLKRDGRIVAKTLSEQLNLSEDTIRRDLRELAAEGLLQRVHGGALPSSPARAVFAERQTISTADKEAIGRMAASLVLPGQVVSIDGGTTALQLVRHLPPDLEATVVTHSPSIAVALVDHPRVEVILIGGRLYKHSIVALGASAVAAIGAIRADRFFMGVCSVDPHAGLSTGDFEEACVKRAFCEAAAETVVLASPEKLNTASPFRIVGLERVGRLVVNAGVDDELVRPYAELGIVVHRA